MAGGGKEPAIKLTTDEPAWTESSQLVSGSSQFMFGNMFGYCAGFALKQAMKVAAFGIGSTFIAVQALSYSGYIEVDWRRVQREVQGQADRAGGASGIFNNVILPVLTFNIPAGTGFTSGLFLGLGSRVSTAGGAAAFYGASGKLLGTRVAATGAAATASTCAASAALQDSESEPRS